MSNDPSHADPVPAHQPDLVASALERLRLRLLDLSLANRLLSFKHGRKSALRVVDELPDVLWNRLQDGDELVFVPVPEPPPDVLVHDPVEPPAEPGPGRKPTPCEHAETLGLATSFDLPAAPEGDVKPKLAHRDKLIQTMHYPDELEAILRGIAGSSRSAIEETGSNMLFLIFGFLEWRETPSSDSPLLAPLLTLPVSMRRGDVDPRTRTFRYFVTYSGEDPGFNASLHEKMRRDFDLALPRLEDGECPEAYFERVRTAIADLRTWKVRRQITLSLLSFGKLLMYQDLDPARWPAGREPSAHPRVRELLAGSDRPVGQVAREYQLDADELRAELPPVVVDADSSQHSALVDALRGRNLVIQGPPGTGKSQTIANLIAAAMLAGKTVLFVSEKLAALEVVRRRLDAAGLGAFCLELHSHKTQKQEFLKDIARRLELRGSFRDPADLDEKLEVLARSRERLTTYAQALHAPFGASKRSAFDLVWAAELQRVALEALAASADDLPFPDATGWTLGDFESCRELVESYATHIAATRAVAANGSHPWQGVTRPCGDDQQAAAYVKAVELIAGLAGQIADEAQRLSEAADLPVVDSRPALEAFAAGIRALPVAAPDDGPVLASLDREGRRASLAAFLERLERFAAAGSALAGKVLAVPSDPAQLQACKLAAERLAQPAARATTLAGVERAASGLDLLPPRLGWYESIRAQVCSVLGASLPSTLRGAVAAIECAAAARSAPWSALSLRDPAADPSANEQAYRAALVEAQALWQEGTALSQHFELSLLPDAATLSRHLGACVTAGPLKFLDAGFKAAEQCFASLAKVRRDAEPEEMARAFQRLASYASRVAAFAQSADVRAAVGPGFRGMATPFQEISAARAWQMRAAHVVSTACPGAGDIARRLVSAPADALRAVASLVSDLEGCRADLRAIADALPSIAPGLPVQGDPGSAPLAELARAAAERATAMRADAATLGSAGFAPLCELATLPAMVGAVDSYLDLIRKPPTSDHRTACLVQLG